MSLLEGLRFTRGDSKLHKLDPRPKFLFTLVIFSMAILYVDLIPLLVIFTVQLPLVFIGKITK